MLGLESSGSLGKVNAGDRMALGWEKGFKNNDLMSGQLCLSAVLAALIRIRNSFICRKRPCQICFDRVRFRLCVTNVDQLIDAQRPTFPCFVKYACTTFRCRAHLYVPVLSPRHGAKATLIGKGQIPSRVGTSSDFAGHIESICDALADSIRTYPMDQPGIALQNSRV